ncbi:MAG TPA: cytochrome b N-terminal domain-containing protein [Pyrinomonadaceae bacterium]|nr:cytochrome b N-terminal domain-containing protein [Pyrinomonadaceae bacterium]
MSDQHASIRTRDVESCAVARRTMLGPGFGNLLDEPSRGFDAWARTTAGLVALLFILQLVTGLLLAFYYVPAADSAFATIAYVEKVLPAGSWIRALHFYGSQLLPAALVLHLAQMLRRGAYARRPVAWLACVALLALSLANGATGYSLPWDARAFFSTNVAENVTGGLPFAGATLRAWLVGGPEISTLTLSRFFALHALVVPFLLLAVACARLFVFRDPDAARADRETEVSAHAAGRDEVSTRDADRAEVSTWARAQFARNALVCGVAFLALALYAAHHPAPLGPSADAAPPGYLPRPGIQFLWLFELLKLFPKTVGSLVAFFLPALIFGALALLPFARTSLTRAREKSRRKLGQLILIFTVMLIAGLTAAAFIEDSRDPRTREQFANQAQKEAEFRAAPFTPKRTGDAATAGGAETASPSSNTGAPTNTPPEAFTRNCAKCHGAHAEGHSIYPSLVGISSRPKRTVEDIIAIQNDPRSYGLESRMPSFATKLSGDEKRAVAEWIVSLK